jgi:thiamine pyrophosphokinase
VGDFDSILPDVKDFYLKKKEIIFYHKKETEITDLDKCIYVAIEKQGVILDSNNNMNINQKKTCFIILGASGGRLDHSIGTFHHVYKYINLFDQALNNTDIFMVSKSSTSIYLKNEFKNEILTNDKVINKIYGYSLVPFQGETTVRLVEYGVGENSIDKVETKECKYIYIYFKYKKIFI